MKGKSVGLRKNQLWSHCKNYALLATRPAGGKTARRCAESQDIHYRKHGCRNQGGRGASCLTFPPVFGRPGNPISSRGGRLCLHNTNRPPKCSDFPPCLKKYGPYRLTALESRSFEGVL